MSRISLATHPLLLGFEGLDELVERAARMSGDGFPPYNILQLGEDRYRITLAVAGFGVEDLSVTVEDGSLVVRGKRPSAGEDRVFLHRGIAQRPFQRSFVLAERMEAVAAHYETGLLHVDLERRSPEAEATRIEIESRS